MRKEYSMAKLIRLSSLIYSFTTIVFFMLANLGAGFIAAAQEQAGEGAEITLSSGKLAVVIAVNILAYIELFGYFAIFFEVFLYFMKKNRMARMRQPMPAEERFPTLPFVTGLAFFLLFMSMMRMVL